jgi:hypothetical protein
MKLPFLVSASVVAACLTTVVAAMPGQDPAFPEATSPAKVKEFVAALQAKKLEAFAARDPEGDRRYVAALLVPGVQMLVVSAAHGRPTDIEYYIYRNEHMNAYMDLNSSVLSTDKVFIEDALADGLVAKPPKGLAADAITIAGKPQPFDGLFADPKRRNDKRMPLADYSKAFADADQRYTRLLDRLFAEIKRRS